MAQTFKGPLRASAVARRINRIVREAYPYMENDRHIVSQIGHQVMIESRSSQVLGLIAQTLAQQEGLHLEWGGQWLSGDLWENWLVVARYRYD